MLCQTAIATTVLGMLQAYIHISEIFTDNLPGGISTLTASYLARARGSNEPELSITRVKDLEQFIRECEAFILDHGHVRTSELDALLTSYRKHFEALLGKAGGQVANQF